MTSPNLTLDAIDLALLAELRRTPRASTMHLSRVAGVARNTVTARLRRLETRGVIIGHGPEIDARAAGYTVTAFVNLSIEQGAHDEAIHALAAIPQVLEVHTTTGQGDLLLRVVAETNDHLNEILQRIVATPVVIRSETQLSLHTDLHRTMADLLSTLA